MRFLEQVQVGPCPGLRPRGYRSLSSMDSRTRAGLENAAAFALLSDFCLKTGEGRGLACGMYQALVHRFSDGQPDGTDGQPAPSITQASLTQQDCRPIANPCIRLPIDQSPCRAAPP